MLLPPQLHELSAVEEFGHRIRGSLLLLDASKVESVGTSGMLNVRRFLDLTDSLDAQVVLLGATNAVVTQLNLVPDVAKRLSAFSVLAPYYCSVCELEQRQELLLATPGQAPNTGDQPCISCGNNAQFDDVEAIFFRFMPHLLPVQTDKVAAALKALESQTDRSLTPSKTAVNMQNGTTEVSTNTLALEKEPQHVSPHPNGGTALRDGPKWLDLIFYLLVGAVLAGIALVMLNWRNH